MDLSVLVSLLGWSEQTDKDVGESPFGVFSLTFLDLFLWPRSPFYFCPSCKDTSGASSR